MASAIHEEAVKEFKDYISMHEPYPVSILDDLMLDDKRYNDDRLWSTILLSRMIESGYSEDEVNPWKKQ